MTVAFVGVETSVVPAGWPVSRVVLQAELQWQTSHCVLPCSDQVIIKKHAAGGRPSCGLRVAASIFRRWRLSPTGWVSSRRVCGCTCVELVLPTGSNETVGCAATYLVCCLSWKDEGVARTDGGLKGSLPPTHMWPRPCDSKYKVRRADTNTHPLASHNTSKNDHSLVLHTA